MNIEQPLALKLADELEICWGNDNMEAKAAAELRRLHEAHEWQYTMAGERLRRIEKLEAENEALRDELETVKKSLTVQQPVAWITHAHEPLPKFHRTYTAAKDWGSNPIPLYTSPKPQSEWVGLTDNEVAECGKFSVEGPNMLPYTFARAIEEKLREKNQGK